MEFTIGPMVMGTGMILIAASMLLLVAGLILLVKLLRTDWNMTVNDFNAKFAYESSLRPFDMQQDIKRKEIASKLGVQAAKPVAGREISVRAQRTELMDEPDRTEEL